MKAGLAADWSSRLYQPDDSRAVMEEALPFTRRSLSNLHATTLQQKQESAGLRSLIRAGNFNNSSEPTGFAHRARRVRLAPGLAGDACLPLHTFYTAATASREHSKKADFASGLMLTGKFADDQELLRLPIRETF